MHSTSAISPPALRRPALSSRPRASAALRSRRPSVCCRTSWAYWVEIASKAVFQRCRASGRSIRASPPAERASITWSSTSCRAFHSGPARMRSVCVFAEPVKEGTIWSCTSQRRVCTNCANRVHSSSSIRPDGQARVSRASSWEISSAACSRATSGPAREVRSPSSTWESSWKAWICSSTIEVYWSSACSAVMSLGSSTWLR